MAATLSLGLDVGSTTLKLVALGADPRVPIFEHYARHCGEIVPAAQTALDLAAKACGWTDGGNSFVRICVTGSAGLFLARMLALPAAQEVVACSVAIAATLQAVDTAIELGGEDAKLLRLRAGHVESAAMNSTCAAGTGSFIDTTAALLGTDASGLNDLAAHSTTKLTIASRCGVFAKTDIAANLAEGARKEDVAAAVFSAVVTQAVAGLAQGRPIAGRVALLGGPLHFLPQLRKAFADALSKCEVVSAPFAHEMVAIGAALSSGDHAPMPAAFLLRRFQGLGRTTSLLSPVPSSTAASAAEQQQDDSELTAAARLAPLFSSPEELAAFRSRHARATAQRADLAKHTGPTFLGIDCGSTSLKLVLTDAEGRILFDYYVLHDDKNVLRAGITAVEKIHAAMPPGAFVARCTTTGYGEQLLGAALGADAGVVETVAHLRGARMFLHTADFVLDIGGQDVKALRAAKDGSVLSISLNEACSSGCGSFIQTMATTMHMPLPDFADAGLRSRAPLDLGTRCTVFMQSRIKQAQKDGATVEDISAGIALAVVRNALFKVIRLHSAQELEHAHVIVQGGTFYNDAVLRAAEVIIGKEIVRPDVSGLMGALGAALISRDAWKALRDDSRQSKLLSPEALGSLSWEASQRRCTGCANTCKLTVHTFSNGAVHVSGNRCERGAVPASGSSGKKPAAVAEDEEGAVPNVAEWQRRRVFRSTPVENPRRGQIGIPRVFAFWDDFPFWQTCLSALGFEVVLSNESNDAMWEMGVETIPVEGVCFPAKLAHGHIVALASRKVKKILLPVQPFAMKETRGDPDPTSKRFNCSLLNDYADVLHSSLDLESRFDAKLLHPQLPVYDEERMVKRLQEELSKECPTDPLTEKECREAVAAGFAAQAAYRAELRAKGEEALAYIRKTGSFGIVVACRPYQLDPKVAGGISGLVRSCAVASELTAAGKPCVVLTADSIHHLGRSIPHPAGFPPFPEKYAYDVRLTEAARFASRNPEVGFLLVTSFGCAVSCHTADYCQALFDEHRMPWAMIKVDQSTNAGALRVRIRSLLAAIDEHRSRDPALVESASSSSATAAASASAQAEPAPQCLVGTPQCLVGTPQYGSWTLNHVASLMPKAPHVLLLADFSPEHTELWRIGFNAAGHNVHILPVMPTSEATKIGLTLGNADGCFGCVLVAGQYVWALRNKYDPNTTSVLWLHQGGACTAPWLGMLVRKGLVDAGLGQVQVHALDFSGAENPGMSMQQTLRLNMGTAIGDLLQNVVQRLRPYELNKGSVDELYNVWFERSKAQVRSGYLIGFGRFARKLVADFAALPLTTEEHTKPRVGIAGIMGKALPDFWHWMKHFLEFEGGCEVVVPHFSDYSTMTPLAAKTFAANLTIPRATAIAARIQRIVVNLFRNPAREALKTSKRFLPIPTEDHLYELATAALSGTHMDGEGWTVLAHTMWMLENGINNIFLLVPFGCLSGHVGINGVLGSVRKIFPSANIHPIEFDSGQSFTNQYNRIHMLLGFIKNGSGAAAEIAATNKAPVLCTSTDLEDLGTAPCAVCASAAACVLPKKQQEA